MSGTSRPVVGNPAWRLLEQDGRLVAAAGSDEVWVVDDAPGTVLAELAACWGPTPPTPDRLSPQARLAVEQLRSVGALGPRVELSTAPRVATVVVGAELPDWSGALARAIDGSSWESDEPGDADVLVAVRTTATWECVREEARGWVAAEQLHLLVDLAAAHTVAIGPFAVPGHSACAGCLASRVMARWGDPEPPERPGATGPAALAVAAGLVATQLESALQGDLTMVDRTAAVDLRTATATSSPCLRSPRCSCSELVTDGRVELPW